MGPGRPSEDHAGAWPVELAVAAAMVAVLAVLVWQIVRWLAG